MRTINIFGIDYELVDSLESISIPDSFVMNQNKIYSGNGEAKLYVGHNSNELFLFFGERGFELPCFVLKENLINFLEETRIEYLNPTQDYREKERLPTIWETKMGEVKNLSAKLDFNIVDQVNIQGPRVYVNSKDVNYKLLRAIPLPIISHLNIHKLRNQETKGYEYYFELYSDYKNEISEEDEVSNNDSEPFDAELISIDTKTITMETLLRRLKQNTITLNPDFQRNEVWTIKKKCQLIESLMLKIPLPMFYVSADDKNNYTVVDGLQRLSTIRDFLIENKFRLQDLEFWAGSLDGLSFSELPIHLGNRILETEFTFTVINTRTPEVVKRNIFKRVNRGGEPLTDQEIRHALYSGPSTVFLKNLASHELFLEATGESINPKRMLDREFILRALSFIIFDYIYYAGNIDTFLSNTLQVMNFLPNLQSTEAKKALKNIDISSIKPYSLNDLKEMFINAMKRAEILFGDHAFRKSYYGKRRTPINKALFEVWGSILGKLSQNEFDALYINREEFKDEYIQTFLTNPNFDEVLSRNALTQSAVFDRHQEFENLVNSYILI